MGGGCESLMVAFDPHSLYSRADLAEMLKPMGIDVDTFIRKTRPVRRFKMAFWGKDLIEGLNTAPPLSEESDTPKEGKAKPSPAPRRGGARGIEESLDPLKRIVRREGVKNDSR